MLKYHTRTTDRDLYQSLSNAP